MLVETVVSDLNVESKSSPPNWHITYLTLGDFRHYANSLEQNYQKVSPDTPLKGTITLEGSTCKFSHSECAYISSFSIKECPRTTTSDELNSF